MASSLTSAAALLEQYNLGKEECSKKVTDKHLVTISSSYCKKWRFIYPYLDMTSTDVTNAEKGGNDEESKGQRFLERWKEKKGCDATYIKLINALLEVECRNDAESVCELLHDKPSPPIVSAPESNPPNPPLVLPGMSLLL